MKISKLHFFILFLLVFSINSCLFASLKTGSARIIGKATASFDAIYDSYTSSSRSIIKPATLNKVRGDFGEALTDLDYLSRLNGVWKKITPRQGSQGLDHIYIEFEKGTRPKGCIIADTKVNSSKLGMVENWTVTQMSYKWRTDRVKGIVKQYDEFLTDVSEGKFQYKTSSKNDTITVSYPISEKSYYWKDSNGSLYLHDGGDVTDVNKQTKMIRDYLDGVASGAINSRNRLIHYNLSSSGEITESVYDLVDDGNTSVIQGKLLEQRVVSGKAAKEVLENNQEIISSLSKKYGLSKRQLKSLHLSGEEYVEMINYTGKGKIPSIVKKAYRLSFGETFGVSSFIGGTLNLAGQLMKGNFSIEKINATELIKSGLFAGGSSVVFKLGRIASEKISRKLLRETTTEAISENGTKIITKAASEAIETATQKAAEKISSKLLKEGLSSTLDFGIGFGIDGIRIGYNWLFGQANINTVYQSLGRAAFVNFIPELVGLGFALVPGVGFVLGPLADITLSIILELRIPEVNDLSPSVLYAEINDNPDVYKEWIANIYTPLAIGN